MKWIKLSDELPPFNKEIVLLSERGSTRLTFRKTKEATDKFQALLRNTCKRIANIDNPSPMYNEMGLQTKLNTSGNTGVCFQINQTNNEGGDEV